MRPQDIVGQIKAMKGLMPEANRTLIAGRFVAAITKTIEDNLGTTSEAAGAWHSKGIEAFLNACQLTEPLPEHPIMDPAAINVDGFISRWQKINGWRPKDAENDDEWRDFTDEQNLIRNTILMELDMVRHGKKLPHIPDKDKDK